MKHADLLAGIGAVGWAVTALFVPQIAGLCSPEISFGFGMLATGRWLAAQRKTPE